MRGMDVICSHCGRTMRTRTSKQPHPDYRKLYLECLNPDCGARARADFVITETLSPSGNPNPDYKERLAATFPWRRTDKH